MSVSTSQTVYVSTPIGILKASYKSDRVLSVLFTEEEGKSDIGYLSELIRKEITQYFSGDLKQFSLPFDLGGSGFQRKVYEAVMKIPYGETRTYGWISEQLGRRGSERAVGGVNGMNKLLLLVPCHRVLGVGGKLTGYSGGLDRKRFLLDLERGSQGLLF
jgi:methylated-DNA-[protein]-cysteine S-methyltransferase